MGHAKNPPGHRDVNHTRVDAARLIVFASHLLEIVEPRVEALTKMSLRQATLRATGRPARSKLRPAGWSLPID
jgi:hypothetical protein